MKKTLALSTLALAVLAGCQSTSSTLNETTAKLIPQSLVVSPNDTRAYDTVTLENGIDVILVSDPSAQKSAAALSVGVGLLHDPMSQQGMAHYLEHMLFLGTERYPDSNGYSDFMTKNGGAHNASTWLDVTNYMFKVNNDAYGEALDRFSDFFKAPKLYPQYTEKEKNAVNAEWSMRREIDFFGQFKLARQLMGEHPANRFLIGNLETLGDKEGSNLHQETVAFYNQYYSANIMKVAMISNKPINEMQALAQQYFGDIENKNIAEPEVTAKLDFDQAAGKRIYYKPNADVKQLNLDFTIENNMDEFALKPNHFVSYLLSNEMPGSPAQILRDKGWVANLSASASPNMYGNYGTLSVMLQLTDEGMKNREEIVATIMRYIALIKDQGVDEKYFNEMRTALNNQFKFLEKSDEFSYVSALSSAMQDYPLNNTINAPFYYGEFNQGAINNVLSQLNADTLRVWYISQQEEVQEKLHFYDGQYRIEELGEQEVASWQQASQFELKLPSVNRLLPENFDIKTAGYGAQDKPKVAYQSDKITIWQQPSQYFSQQPKGIVEVYVNNPSPLNSAKATVLASIWTDLYSQAQTTLATEASVAGMSVGMDPGKGFTLTVSGFTDKQGELLKQALGALNVQTNDTAFSQAVDRYVRRLKNQGQEFPFRQAFAQYSKLIRTGNYSTQELIGVAQNLTPSDLSAHINTVMNNNTVRVFTFGNYDDQSIAEIAQDIESALPSSKTTTAYARAKAWKPQPNEVYVLQKDLDVADVAIIDMAYHPTPGYAQKAAAAVLQGHMRTNVFDKLRTEEQLAYAVGALVSPLEEYAGIGLFIQTPVNDVKTMQARFETFKAQYQKTLNSMDEQTFAQLKNATLVSLQEPPKNLNDELGLFISDWYRENFDFDSKQKLIDAVKEVTLADVKAFYQATMMNPDAARLNVQLRGSKFADKPFATLKGATQINDLNTFYE